ncbi:MAG TPA: cytochrome P450 [Gemmatimonadota bacterium]|nr:cytochrome P450 [Gemmatimonadota bacterium]
MSATARAALDESLRLYPVSSMILRDTLEDHVADGGAGPRPDHYPYGLGPRYCIGAGYSQVAMPLLLECFLRCFRVELVSAVPGISHSLPLSLRSTRVRLTACS